VDAHAVTPGVRNPIIEGIELLVEQAVDRRLPEMIAARVAEELSRRPVPDTEVFSSLVSAGNVYLQIKAAAAIAGCHPRTIKRALGSGELRRYSVGADPRVRLRDLAIYMARGAQGEGPESIRERARAMVRGAGRTAP
jgi:hypothetical protein